VEEEYFGGPQVTACLYTGISSKFFLNADPVLCKYVEWLAPLVWLRLKRDDSLLTAGLSTFLLTLFLSSLYKNCNAF
jgi:hypothetical protein